MGTYELIATTTFGVEAVAKRELLDLGFAVTKTENGKVTFLSDAAGIAKANLWLRSVDRVLLKVGEFRAETFDELFERTRDLDWSSLIPADGRFPVNGKSVKSKLFSISDCQAIVKKAIVEKLKAKYGIAWFAETGAECAVLVSMLEDVATITLDTSGIALFKRGYRVSPVAAPLKETLAAALVLLSYYARDRVLFDPFCGSGTIPIEAALIGRNIAPGRNRDFAAKHWDWIGDDIWTEAVRQAERAVDHDVRLSIRASDIDAKSVRAAVKNAEAAGVADDIACSVADFRDVAFDVPNGILIANPPYGERLTEDLDLQRLYADLGKTLARLDTWSLYVLTSHPGFPRSLKRKPDRVRKLFNGNIETTYYQFYGPKPPLKP